MADLTSTSRTPDWDGLDDSSLQFLPETESDLQTPVHQPPQQPQDDSSSRSHSQYSQNHRSTPFFADATLDLDEAHGIAETPEAVPRAVVAASSQGLPALQLPQDQLGVLYDDEHRQIPTPLALGVPSEDARALAASGPRPQQNTTTVPTATSQKSHFARITSSLETDSQAATVPGSSVAAARNHSFAPRPKTRPSRPRDMGWALAFAVLVPLGLLGPLLLTTTTPSSSSAAAATHTNLPLTQYPLSTASLHTLLWTGLAALLLTRILYLTRDGGAMDLTGTTASLPTVHLRHAPLRTILSALWDASTRWDTHALAGTLTRLAPVGSVAVACLATALGWWAIPSPLPRLLLTLASLAFLLRQDHVSPLRWWRRRRHNHRNMTEGHDTVAAATATTASAWSSRLAFFRTLLCMALEVLARSLRRRSFYRAMTLLVVVQWGLLCWWRWAMLRLLQTKYASSVLWWSLTIVAGKWATGTCARMIGLVASGGVLCWFMEQAEQLPSSSRSEAVPVTTTDAGAVGSDTHTEVRTHGSNQRDSDIPEAYRAVDASVYESVIDMDDALEDDYDLEEAELETFGNGRTDRNARAPSHTQQVTVRNFLSAGLTVSFGSVAQCGLLGGLAQFVWCQVRKVEAAQSSLAQARQGGFQGMQIGRGSATLLSRIGGTVNEASRRFVRRFSDLPMSHVAAYYRSYHVAARDVALIVEESGIEHIIHDDISTHMCACVGGAIAGLIVVVTHFIMVHQLRATAKATDMQIVENFILSFVLSYTLMFTVMEPIRAAIKSIYVSFAQHPRSLSHTFPLVYHRLQRLSEN